MGCFCEVGPDIGNILFLKKSTIDFDLDEVASVELSVDFGDQCLGDA